MSIIKNIHIKPIVLVLHILVWGNIILFPLFFNTLNRPYPERIHPDSVLFRILLMALFYINAYYLIGRLFNRKKLVTYVSSLILLIVLLLTVPLVFRQPPPPPPEKRIDGRFPLQKMDEIRPPISIHKYQRRKIFRGYTYVIQGMGVLLISTAFGLMIKYDKQNKERETETLKSELSFLRSQINPHFMLNTLNNLVSLARKKSDLLEPSLFKLSGIMKYMLFESENEKVNILQEVEYLKNYIELQKLRFDQDVTIHVELDNDYASLEIAPLILIPFVENAFKHGIILIDKPEINIRLTITDNVLSFIVKNKFNRGVKEDKDKSPGVGLTNVKRRLDLVYPDSHRLNIVEEKGWYKVSLLITLK